VSIVNIKCALLELLWLDIIAIHFISQTMMEGANMLLPNRRTISELTIRCYISQRFCAKLGTWHFTGRGL